jgi:hypothetical protein
MPLPLERTEVQRIAIQTALVNFHRRDDRKQGANHPDPNDEQAADDVNIRKQRKHESHEIPGE